MHDIGHLGPETIVLTQLHMSDITGLLAELEELKAENAKLTEWVSWGKYSAK